MTKRAGDRLRAFCATWCAPATMATIVDPIVADMQAELATAPRGGHLRRAFLRGRAGWSLGSALLLHGTHEAAAFLVDRGAEDHRMATRTLFWVTAATVLTTAVMTARPIFDYLHVVRPRDVLLVVFLTPQAISVAIPVGLSIGLAFGLGGRYASGRVRAFVLALGLASAIVTLILAGWVTPIGNQAFRQRMVRHVNPAFAASGQVLARGTSEMTLVELAASPSYDRAYYQRLAIGFASAALTVFGVAVATRKRIRRRLALLVGFGSPFVFVSLMQLSAAGMRAGSVPAWAIAWLPTVAFLLAALALVRLMEGSRDDGGTKPCVDGPRAGSHAETRSTRSDSQPEAASGDS